MAVWGCGGIGLNAIQMASIMGASKVIAVDVFPAETRNGPGGFRGDPALDGRKQGRKIPWRKSKRSARRQQRDYAIEAVGSQKTMEQAFEAIHRGGMAVMIGVAPQNTRISVDRWRSSPRRS